MQKLCAFCDKPINVNTAQRAVHPIYLKLVMVCPDGRICKNKYEAIVPVVVHKPKDKMAGKLKHQKRQKFLVGGR